MKDLKILIEECEERISIIENSDLSELEKELLIKENNRFIDRCRQILFFNVAQKSN